jgi:hypothetical protein
MEYEWGVLQMLENVLGNGEVDWSRPVSIVMVDVTIDELPDKLDEIAHKIGVEHYHEFKDRLDTMRDVVVRVHIDDSMAAIRLRRIGDKIEVEYGEDFEINDKERTVVVELARQMFVYDWQQDEGDTEPEEQEVAWMSVMDRYIELAMIALRYFSPLKVVH